MTRFSQLTPGRLRNWRTFELEKDTERALLHGKEIHAVNPDLAKFKARGGKLLIYHGWSDPGIPPSNSVNYYRSVLKSTPDATASVRLFMVPGMGHCGGGDGTSTFDMVAAADRWVETKTAPVTIPASKMADGKVVRTRPLCAFPAVATYKGTGSTDEAASFVCR